MEKKDTAYELDCKRIKFDHLLSPALVGKYKLSKLLGKGSFGNVYMATNKSGKVVAVKEIRAGTDPKEAKRIQNEISILKTVRHSNIIELYEVVQDTSNGVFLVMEYCSGGDLQKYLKSKIALEEFEVQEIVYQVASGLKELYRREIMHRDIKLQNLLRTNKGGETVIKIADFGLARYALLGYASTICGTLPYMPPELIKGQKYNTKADLWSLGVTIFTLLAGKMPFAQAKPQHMLKEISKGSLLVNYKLDKLKVSQCCKDLINQLLVSDHEKRIDKTKFFAHPFVKTAPSQYRSLLCPIEKPLQQADKDEYDLQSSGSGTVFYKSSSDNTSLASSHASSPKDRSVSVDFIPPNKV